MDNGLQQFKQQQELIQFTKTIDNATMTQQASPQFMDEMHREATKTADPIFEAKQLFESIFQLESAEAYQELLDKAKKITKGGKRAQNDLDNMQNFSTASTEKLRIGMMKQGFSAS